MTGGSYDGRMHDVQQVNDTATRVLRDVLAHQPLTPAKVQFAWSVAAGAPLARAATVSWADGEIVVRPQSEAWREEILRARPVLSERLAELLGPEAVRRIVVPECRAARWP